MWTLLNLERQDLSPKGLSARVRNAIARRLQSAMAVRAEAAETPVEEGAPAETPTRGVEQAAEDLQEVPPGNRREGG